MMIVLRYFLFYATWQRVVKANDLKRTFEGVCNGAPVVVDALKGLSDGIGDLCKDLGSVRIPTEPITRVRLQCITVNPLFRKPVRVCTEFPEVVPQFRDVDVCDIEPTDFLSSKEVQEALEGGIEGICECLPKVLEYLETSQDPGASLGEQAGQGWEIASCLLNEFDAMDTNRKEKIAEVKQSEDGFAAAVIFLPEIDISTYIAFVINVATCTVGGCIDLVKQFVDIFQETAKAVSGGDVEKILRFFFETQIVDPIVNAVTGLDEMLEKAVNEIGEMVTETSTLVMTCNDDAQRRIEVLESEVNATLKEVEVTIVLIQTVAGDIVDCAEETKQALTAFEKFMESASALANIDDVDAIFGSLVNGPGDSSLGDPIKAFTMPATAVTTAKEISEAQECIRKIIGHFEKMQMQYESLQEHINQLVAAVDGLDDDIPPSCTELLSLEDNFKSEVKGLLTDPVDTFFGNLETVLQTVIKKALTGLKIDPGVATYRSTIPLNMKLPCSRTKTLSKNGITFDVPEFYSCDYSGVVKLPNQHIPYLKFTFPGQDDIPTDLAKLDPSDDPPEVPQGIVLGTITEKSENSCTVSSGLPADGVDNNCDGNVDDELCDFNDLDSRGRSLRDCMCNPPLLDGSALVNADVSCAADLSPDVLGYPSVRTDTVNDCEEGSFLEPSDELLGLEWPFELCGDAVYIRTFEYKDSRNQASNKVQQTIRTNKEPPILDSSRLEQPQYFMCEEEVQDGLLAPTVPIPDGIGSAPCSLVSQTTYFDAEISFVGCALSDMMDSDANVLKGWNVLRQWTVVDNCGQEASFNQTAILRDESKPSFMSFPGIRVQSCRASFDPANSGYPVAVDNCDPHDILNPDWGKPFDERGGRIEFSDVGSSSSGCPRDFVRTFEVSDRVCNTNTDSHKIEANAFDFIGDGSYTEYDSSSLLATFQIRTGKRSEFYNTAYPNDALVMVSSDGLSTVPVVGCIANGTIEYIDQSGAGTWHSMVENDEYGDPIPLDADKVIDFGFFSSDPTFAFELPHYLALARIFDDFADERNRVLFRVPVSAYKKVEDPELPGRFQRGEFVEGHVTANLQLDLGFFGFEQDDEIDGLAVATYDGALIPTFEVLIGEKQEFEADLLLFESDSGLKDIAVRDCKVFGPLEYKTASGPWLPVPHYKEDSAKDAFTESYDVISFDRYQSYTNIYIREKYQLVFDNIFASAADSEGKVYFRFLTGCYQNWLLTGCMAGKGGKGSFYCESKGGKGGKAGPYVEGRGEFALKIASGGTKVNNEWPLGYRRRTARRGGVRLAGDGRRQK